MIQARGDQILALCSPDRGWGLHDETWVVIDRLESLGGAAWFRLGDRDLATHLFRSDRMRAGRSLTEVTAELCAALGVDYPLWPMSDERVRTIVLTAGVGEAQGTDLPFQDYFVKDQCRPRVTGFRFEGIQTARPQSRMMDLLKGRSLACVVICPSNPFISIDPIIGLPEVREALAGCLAPVLAVSPIVGGEALKGPAAKMMRELGMPVSALAVATYYAQFIDGFVLDEVDEEHATDIERLGVSIKLTNTAMKTPQDQAMLAREVLNFATTIGMVS